MQHNGKNPLGKKFENFSLHSSKSSFDYFEKRNKRKGVLWIIPILLLAGLSFWLLAGQFGKTIEENELVAKSGTEITHNTDNEVNDYSQVTEEHVQDKENDAITNSSVESTTEVVVNEDEPYKAEPIGIESESNTDDVVVDAPISGISDETLNANLAYQKITLKPISEVDFGPFSILKLPKDSLDSIADKDKIYVASTPSSPLWEAGVSFGPKQSRQIISPADGAEKYIHKMYQEYREDAQSSAVGMNFSFIVNYNGFSLGSFRSGLIIDQLRFKENYMFEVDSVPVYDIDNRIAGYVALKDSTEDNSVEASTQQNYLYVSVPLAFSKKIDLGSQWQLMLNPSISFNMLFGAGGSVLDENDVFSIKDIEYAEFNKFSMNYGLEAGVLYKIDRIYRVGLSAYYNRSTRPNEQQAFYTTTNYTYGLNLNVIYIWKWK